MAMTKARLDELINEAEKSLNHRENDLDNHERELHEARAQVQRLELWVSTAKSDTIELNEKLSILRLAREAATE